MSDMPERVFVSPLENDANGATVREAFSRQAVRAFFCEPYIRADLYEFQRETIAALQAESERLRKALEWYAEQCGIARKVTIDANFAQERLTRDGGQKARAALQGKSE